MLETRKAPVLTKLLQQQNISPILVDIGSSNAEASVLRPIASESVIIGFDADNRGQDLGFAAGYKGHHLVPKAVVFDGSSSVEFVLTQFPPCSSVLEPDLDALKEMIFHDYFVPESRASVPATNLEAVIADLGIERYDWVKLDSQGTDLRILQSLSETQLAKISAIEIEPGLIEAYQGEDRFPELHQFLLHSGFWLSDLNLQRYARVSPDSFRRLQSRCGIPRLDAYLKRSPTAAEGRYFRKINYLKQRGDERQIVLAIVFGMLDDQLGYSFDALNVYRDRFGTTPFAQRAEQGILALIKGVRLRRWPQVAVKRIYRALRRTVAPLIPGW